MATSFRVKIILYSLVLSGLTLIAFGFFSVSVTRRIGITRIDRELRALGDEQMRKSQPGGHWARFYNSLRSMYGEEQSRQFVLRVSESPGAPSYTSPGWTNGLHRVEFPELPTETLGEENIEPEKLNPRRSPRPFDKRNPRPRLEIAEPVFLTAQSDVGAYRLMVMANREVTLILGMNLAGLQADLLQFQHMLYVAVPAVLLFLFAGGWLLSHQALRPVNLIAETTELITAQGLDERIPGTNADREFKRLIDVINQMLDRLEKSFGQAVRFSADAAHELKTPLAILQGQIEQRLRREVDGSEEQQISTEQLEEVERLKAIIRKLLLLSRADAGQMPLKLEKVDLSRMANTVCEDVQMIAPHLTLTVDIQPDITVSADSDLLNQAIQNLSSNAIKFSGEDGAIDIQLKTTRGRAELSISNTGAPIPEEDHDRIFERFYRVDKSRSRDAGGSGLGLALAREISRAHQGDIVLKQNREEWNTFVLILPLVSDESS
jgi:two-component system, OmpR family, heavy metal sensor histidine kinase CusS